MEPVGRQLVDEQRITRLTPSRTSPLKTLSTCHHSQV
jgi:hypothetical protein